VPCLIPPTVVPRPFYFSRVWAGCTPSAFGTTVGRTNSESAEPRRGQDSSSMTTAFGLPHLIHRLTPPPLNKLETMQTSGPILSLVVRPLSRITD
jgi:hypothetical protein